MIIAYNGQRAAVFANYSYLDATFRESFTVPSPNNPAAIDGEISVDPGDRLPLTPDHLFKAGGRFDVTTRFRISGDLLVSAGAYFRGDEGNLTDKLSSYSLLNVRAEYRINDNALVFLNVNNLLDEEYETFGLFGEADEVLGDAFEDARFVSPGAPRAAWLGVRLTF